MSDTRWIEATSASSNPARPLTAEQIASWREAGFAFVSGLFKPALISALRADADALYPAAGDPAAHAITDFGSGGRLAFPARSAAFNAVTLHPRLLRALADLLGTEVVELRLTQSDLWPKYGRDTVRKDDADNDDQRMHVDYPNHTLAHPPPWDRPEAVELILYLDRVEECGGATAVAPRDGPNDPAYRWPIVDTPGVADLDWINDRSAAERYFAERRPALAEWRQSLYARERRVRFAPGDVLLYRHDTWHRGTPLLPGRRRLAHNLTFRRASAEWVSTLHVGWAWSAYSPNKLFERLIAQASPEQRTVLGFPRPGASYWTPETIAAIEARYGVFGFDVTPYRAALPRR
jgi:hypothetical protein